MPTNEDNLHKFAFLGNVKGVRDSLDAGANINFKNAKGETALSIASHRGHLQVVELLISEGAGINERDCGGKTPFMEAVQMGKEDVVLALERHGADVDAVDEIGNTAIMYAIENMQIKILGILIGNTMAVDLQNKHGHTALDYAIDSQSVEVVSILMIKEECKEAAHVRGIVAVERCEIDNVKILVRAGVDADILLGRASGVGCGDIVQVLLEEGATIDVRDIFGRTFISIAAENGNLEAATALTEAYERKYGRTRVKEYIDRQDRYERNPTIHAAKERHGRVLEYLLNHGRAAVVVQDSYNKQAIEYAIENEDVDSLVVLMRFRALDRNPQITRIWELALQRTRLTQNVNVIGLLLHHILIMEKAQRSLETAVEVKNKEEVELLTAAGVDVNRFGASLLKRAVRNGDPGILQLLAVRTVRDIVNEALLYASNIGAADAVRILIHEGQADVDTTYENQRSSLIGAAREGYVTTVIVLLEEHASVNLRDSLGRTALIHAAMQGRFRTVVELLRARADTNVKDSNNKIALEYAFEGKRIRTTIPLIEAGSDVSIRDRNKKSLLIRAIEEGYDELVEPLLRAGVDVNALDVYGKTAIRYALERRKEGIVRRLLEANARVDLKDAQGRDTFDYLAEEGLDEVMDLLPVQEEVVRQPVSSHQRLWGRKLREAITRKRTGGFNGAIRKANINAIGDDGKTFLMVAFDVKNFEAAERLIEYHINLEIRDNDGNPVLVRVIKKRNLPAVRMLLRSDPSLIHSRGSDRETPLMVAVEYGDSDTVGEILGAGARVEEVDNLNRSAVTRAVQNERTDMLELLLSRIDNPRIFLNEKDAFGRTSMSHAAESGSENNIRILRDYGALVVIVDSEGRCPREYASKQGYSRLAKILYGWGTEDREAEGERNIELIIHEPRSFAIARRDMDRRRLTPFGIEEDAPEQVIQRRRVEERVEVIGDDEMFAEEEAQRPHDEVVEEVNSDSVDTGISSETADPIESDEERAGAEDQRVSVNTLVAMCKIEYANHFLNYQHSGELFKKAYEIGGNKLCDLLMDLGKHEGFAADFINAMEEQGIEHMLYELMSSSGSEQKLISSEKGETESTLDLSEFEDELYEREALLEMREHCIGEALRAHTKHVLSRGNSLESDFEEEMLSELISAPFSLQTSPLAGYKAVGTPSDGNCMFNAVLIALFGNSLDKRELKETMLELRNNVADRIFENARNPEFIENTRHLMTQTLEEAKKVKYDNLVEAYVALVRESGMWGDELVIRTIAEVLNVRIVVHQNTGITILPLSEGSTGPIIHIYYHGCHYSAYVSEREIVDTRVDHEAISATESKLFTEDNIGHIKAPELETDSTFSHLNPSEERFFSWLGRLVYATTNQIDSLTQDAMELIQYVVNVTTPEDQTDRQITIVDFLIGAVEFLGTQELVPYSFSGRGGPGGPGGPGGSGGGGGSGIAYSDASNEQDDSSGLNIPLSSNSTQEEGSTEVGVFYTQSTDAAAVGTIGDVNSTYVYGYDLMAVGAVIE